MEKSRVYLDFPSDISFLAGYDYAKLIFKEQIEGELKSKNITLVFPKRIEYATTSFCQVIFWELSDRNLTIEGSGSLIEKFKEEREI